MNHFLILGNAGWCNIQIGRIKSRASYLTNVPIDCLEAAVDYLKNGNPIILHFDAEGWDFTIKSFAQGTTFNWNKDDEPFSFYFIKSINANKLSEYIYKDISSNISGWCDFLFCFDDLERENLKSKMALLLQELKKLLNENEMLAEEDNN